MTISFGQLSTAGGIYFDDLKQAITQGAEGTGVLSAQAATLSGTGNKVANITGTGTLTAQAATFAGTGDRNVVNKTVTGTGVLDAQEATFVGDGEAVIYQVGGLVSLHAQPAEIVGSGVITVIKSGSGVLNAEPATVDGTGTEQASKTGSGVLNAQEATLSGSGNLTAVITGTGTLTAEEATFDGSGFRRSDKIGSGVLTADPATFNGFGNRTKLITGAGVIDAERATLVAGGIKISPNFQVISPIASVAAYQSGTRSTYALQVAFEIQSIRFTYSSDDPDYIDGTQSVHLYLFQNGEELELGSLNAIESPQLLLYETQGVDIRNRFEALRDALLAGPAIIGVAGWRDDGAFSTGVTQDGGIMIHDLQLAA